jgi:ABC-2 type transport system ATP-binding protein
MDRCNCFIGYSIIKENRPPLTLNASKFTKNMTETNYAVEINDLSKDYESGFLRKKRVRAIDSLTLNVKPGQIFGFLGGNGAGKTTTIKILMRLIFPTEGSARILGHDISDVQMHRRIGYCPENPYFYDYLTARELMEYFGELFGQTPGHRREKTAELLTAVGLPQKDWKRQLRKFSKGMLQRVGLAQSLINDPEIVFLDEPMSGLDPMGRREVRELIAALREKGTTVFMSTHILSDIEALCDEVAILRAGRLAASGNLSDLLTRSGETRVLEISVQGLEGEAIRDQVEFIAGASISPEPNGAVIQVLDESDVEAVLKITRLAGGHLASVQPIKQSLEELFVKETSDR